MALNELDPLTAALREQRVRGLLMQDPKERSKEVQGFFDTVPEPDAGPSFLDRLFFGASPRQGVDPAVLAQQKAQMSLLEEQVNQAREELNFKKEQAPILRKQAKQLLRIKGRQDRLTARTDRELESERLIQESELNREAEDHRVKMETALQGKIQGAQTLRTGIQAVGGVAERGLTVLGDVLERRAKEQKELETRKAEEGLAYTEIASRTMSKMGEDEAISSIIEPFSEMFDFSKDPDPEVATKQLREWISNNIEPTVISSATSDEQLVNESNRVASLISEMAQTARGHAMKVAREVTTEIGSEVESQDLTGASASSVGGAKKATTKPAVTSQNALSAKQAFRERFDERATMLEAAGQAMALDNVRALKRHSDLTRVVDVLNANKGADVYGIRSRLASVISEKPRSKEEADVQEHKLSMILSGVNESTQIESILETEKALSQFDELGPNIQEYLRQQYPERFAPKFAPYAPGVLPGPYEIGLGGATSFGAGGQQQVMGVSNRPSLKDVSLTEDFLSRALRRRSSTFTAFKRL